MQRVKPIAQDYSTYTSEDFEVWKVLFEQQISGVKEHASQLYLEALGVVSFNAEEIPDFEKTTAILKEQTGWQITTVPELVPQKEFFEMLISRQFPATCWLRTMEELNYIEEPDMFHDVFGHIPLLVNPAYAQFMQSFGELAMKWIHDSEAIAILARVYWYTIEFGLLNEAGQNKIFGAGIISSIGETAHVYSNSSVKIPFNIDQMLNLPYRIDTLQPTFFIMDSFEQLCSAIPGIDAGLSKLLSEQFIH